MKQDYYNKIKLMCSSCVACNLCDNRTQVVFGYGDFRASVMFVGRDPGADEDYLGIPFVGRAGERLQQSLNKIGINRRLNVIKDNTFNSSGLYITNLNKCHSEKNIGPTEEQRQACFKWLKKEIRFIKPQKIVLFGKDVMEFILGKIGSITQVAGKEFKCVETGIVFIPMLHTSYLIRNLNKVELQEEFDLYIAKIFEM